MTKEASLLSDSTDIFSDVPAPVARESKKKGGPKKAATEKKGVFKDDVGEWIKKSGNREIQSPSISLICWQPEYLRKHAK